MYKINTTLFGEVVCFPFEIRKPLLEILQWKTNVNKWHDGSESRVDLISQPRKSFDYNVPASGEKKVEASNILYGSIRNNLAIPVWTQPQFVGNVTGGSTTILCETENYDFKSNGLAILFNSFDNFELVEIETVNVNSIDLYGSGVETRLNAVLYPVELAIINNNVSKGTNTRKDDFKLRLNVKKSKSLVAEVPEQFEDTDIYVDLSYEQNPIVNKNIFKEQNIVDFELGDFEQFTNHENTGSMFSFSGLLDGLDEIATFKKFLQRRLGKFRPFWYPTHENDFNLEIGFQITNSFYSKSKTVVDFNKIRRYIIIFDKNGNYYPREITYSSQIDDDSTVIVLDSDVNIHSSDVKYISYLMYCRLNADRIELNHIGNNKVEFNIPFVELKPYKTKLVVIE